MLATASAPAIFSSIAAWAFLIGTALLADEAAARGQNVERWVENDLAHYVAAKIADHPRFKGAALRFVVMKDGSPAAEVDALSLKLRDSLQEALIDAPGVTVAWQPAAPHARRRFPQGGADCSAGDVQYFIGIELRAGSPDEALVSVRALDAVEKTWVSGFGTEWRGRLDRREWRLSRQPALDRTFVGQRSVPYEQTETDLVAAHLAHDLRCELMRQVSGEYVVSRPAASGSSGLDGVLDLVSNHITGISSLQIAVDDLQANALLEGQPHPVDGELYQYWVTITPKDAGSGLQPISSGVYVRIPRQFRLAGPAAVADEPFIPESGDLLEPLELVRIEARGGCTHRRHGYGGVSIGSRQAACLGLQIRTRDDAVVFVLNHQQNNGLVRLSNESCNYRTAARIARANEAITVAMPTSLLRDSWLPETEWRLDPNADVWYAIAVSNGKAARAIADHLDTLPRRCSESVRAGYEGRELEDWLARLSSEVERWQPFVDWNAIRIRNIY